MTWRPSERGLKVRVYVVAFAVYSAVGWVNKVALEQSG